MGSLNDTNAGRWFSRGIIVVLGVTILVLIYRKFIDKKSFVSLGLTINRNTIWDLLVGFFLSGIMAGTFFLILLHFGRIEIIKVGWSASKIEPLLEIVLLFFGVGIATGFSEELGFRGYLLQNLGEGIGLKWAIILSCILYGVLHMSNPNSTLLSGSMLVLFGFLRIFGWLRTGQLWLSIGMHAGWNFFQGPVFGFSVSGLKSHNLIEQTLIGPTWLTGGEFGPEGSIIVLPVVLLALAVMYFWTTKRKTTPWSQLKKVIK
ncbi:MAG: CPBP family intramembrane metalloprotease [Bacteroidales bacterium]|nr:CPBP family intramembrane metalloprotease [Bacteroidales bacterium]